MKRNGVLPAFVFYMEDGRVKTSENRAVSEQGKLPDLYRGLSTEATVKDLLEDYSIPYKILDSLDPNSDIVCRAVQENDLPLVLYSGPSGAILRKRILGFGKTFLHIHPGILPEYRGSTTLYYSLLNDGVCGVTGFVLDRKIDTGPIIVKKLFDPPRDRREIDLLFDPYIRAELASQMLTSYERTGNLSKTPQEPGNGTTYYIIHPVLKHIAILSAKSYDPH